MPKTNKGGKGQKNKVYALPTAQKKRGLDVPKLQMKAKVATQARPTSASLAALSSNGQEISSSSFDLGNVTFHDVIDTSLTKDSSSKAFMRELRKVIERSDVIIQVLDARDPEGTRSRWVEDEVRKRDMQGKKLLGVLNKIDLVPRANLEAWLKHLRHSFPTMPFKSSTQSQKQHLSQNAVPLAQPSTVPGKQTVLQELPTTSASLGAPALLHLLKQYALSTPHSSLTVGVVGYPNVGKSSLINSLKRSRACAVAAMPGKTRVVQEVALDKGVKILDCPGVVLEDVGSHMEGEEGRRRRAEIMLRNCVKAELVQDPISPVEVILNKVEPAQLQKLYNIPAYDDVRDFLIKMALIRGRLGKGGVPDLEASAVQVLRDWNSGKISYYTTPPKFHPSSAPAPVPVITPVLASNEAAGDVEMGGDKVGDAKILTSLSEAFTIEGLFDNLGDDAAWEEGDVVKEEGIAEDADLVAPEPVIPPAPVPVQTVPRASLTKRPFMDSEDESDADSDASDSFRPRTTLGPSPAASQPISSNALHFPAQPQTAQSTRLFTAEELAVLPAGLLDRKKAKSLAKKAKKRRAAVERTEGELMAGFMDMDMDEPEARKEMEMEMEMPAFEQKSKKDKRKAKKETQAKQRKEMTKVVAEMEIDEDARKEAEFASFLANMGADGSDEEL
ncbi:nuclear GTP-binding protein, variant [Cryptococcus neoformans var. grubii H99]|uniref:Nuclear GTP-binding protein, variant n=1 Tax=Cryptococcus neoformans (strain H99 / ATCC 208821 / CBS 10515 / FGSC 9487) TaxID=235443 RepID=T2BPS6_CRYN9|nr:nuclear GTP-binding protein, variant [Cryptococcus neoformans var. grubii H99]AGV14692.1 nuclear GTP-binding protein, variant [Cryptococcus neoformans var. grubii H99]|eukprot:XP_012052637.1 nuclear GTP-binding protein, variant [Cryptococcus neoformans var. grubii H99]